MSLISSITKGREAQPPRIMIYGSEGVGKSTFAALAPNPVFVQTEDGLSEIDCSKFPLAKSFDDVVLQLQAVRDEQHDYGTVVIDSLDWLERLVWDRVCADYGVKSIEKADGGYGKGYVHALTYWRQIVSLLNDIRARKGMAVILIAHAAVERFTMLHAAARIIPEVVNSNGDTTNSSRAFCNFSFHASVYHFLNHCFDMKSQCLVLIVAADS